jgi:hypothetical protein
MLLPEDSFGLQPKQLGAIKPVAQLFGERRVCTRKLHGKCTITILSYSCYLLEVSLLAG